MNYLFIDWLLINHDYNNQLNRYQLVKYNGDSEGGSTATMGRPGAIGYTNNGDPEGGSTATIGRAEARGYTKN